MLFNVVEFLGKRFFTTLSPHQRAEEHLSGRNVVEFLGFEIILQRYYVLRCKNIGESDY